MRNQRIVKAYDSINPSIADKQRMLDAILAEAPPMEQPRKQPKPRKKQEPFVYKKKPEKRSYSGIIGGLAACLAVMVIGGFTLTRMAAQQDVNPAYVAPTTEATQSTETAPEFPDTVYTETLEKYRRAIDQGWPREMCVENGMSMLTPIESEYESLYYAISDLDGNGVQELVISEYPYREDTDTGFLDIYTVVDGHVIQLMSLGDTDMRYLCEGGVVKDLTPPETGEYNAYVSFWEIREDQFTQTGAVYSINGEWFHGFRASEKITAAEAGAEVKSLKPAKLDFVEVSPSVETEYLTGYEGFDAIVNKYVTAINENWTTDQCQQNDISPNIFLDATTVSRNLGWCLLDIDKNGVEELVISDGENLFDLYCLMPTDASPGHLISAYPNSYQLCEDGIIQCQEFYSGTTMWRWLELSDIDLVEKQVLFYEGEKNQYFHGTSEYNMTPISKDEVGTMLSTYRTMELDLTPFVEPEPFDPNEMDYYQSLIERYQTALKEKWNPGQCAEKGISLMIGYYGELYKELGYATMDLDNNGIQELIITDGTNIYDLYTIIQDEETGPLRLIDATERQQYFMTSDGYIYCMGSGGALQSYHTLYSLGERELVMVEGYMMDAQADPQNPWFYYDGVERGDPCPDAAAATDAIRFADITFTPFVETPFGEIMIN